MHPCFRLPAVIAGVLSVSAALAAPLPALSAPKKARCAVCSVREGAGPEEVRATATHQGREYYFCSEKCRDEFLKDPAPFVKAQAAAPEEHAHPARSGSVGPSGDAGGGSAAPS